MNRALDEYFTLVFDCDGVILNSNRVKTDAFYQAALPYGEAAAQALVSYHVQNGGVSRYKKFAYFLEHIVKSESSGPGLDELLSQYAAQVHEGLMTCDIAAGLASLRERTSSARWLIVSGGDQSELREVFKARGIAELFDSGIFGSPDTKDEILARELHHGNIQVPALFLGDSKYDYQAATAAGLDFVFISAWSEVENWATWCSSLSLNVCKSIESLTCHGAFE